MPEPDPFASPLHHVRLPGEPEPTATGFGFPGPMPEAPDQHPYATSSPYAAPNPYATPPTGNPYAMPNPYAVPVAAHPYVSASDVHQQVVRRPAALLVSSWSWLAATALVVLGLPGLFLLNSSVLAAELYDEAQGGPDPMSRAESEIVAQLTPLLFVLIFAVLAVPYVVAAIKLRGGRNWPRVLLAVLGAAGVVFGLAMLLAFSVGGVDYVHWVVGTVWSLVFLAAVLLGIVAMFVPPANAYVRAVSAR